MDNSEKAGASPVSKPEQAELVQLLSVSIGVEQFGIDIMEVEEICLNPVVSPIAGAPEYVEGTVRHGEKVVGVVNMRKGFGLEASESDGQSRIVLVKIEGQLAGMLVDSVTGIIRITPSDIEPAGDISMGVVSPAYIKSIANLQDRSIAILDLSKTIEIGRLSKAVTDLSG